MRLHRFNTFNSTNIEEYKKFEDFEGALRFGDWSDFEQNLSKAVESGFTTVDELIEKLGMDVAFYKRVKDNMIDSWIDSVSKSLLHGISGVDLEIPEAGDVIFKDPEAQTRFIIVAGPGHSARNMFGDTNRTPGLGLWGIPSLKEISTGKSPFVIKADKPLTLADNKHDKLNELLQYVWVYVFFNDYLRKKQNVKLPKVLYRGIRIQNLYKYPQIERMLKGVGTESEGEFHWARNTKARMDAVIQYIVDNGISEITDGNYLSFTGTLSVAEYFANNTGIVIKVDPSKVRVVTSPLTDENFAEPNWHSGKKENEYIVMVPDNYKFTRDDIMISSEDYLLGDNSPLAVQYFSHDDKKATYDLYVPEKDKTYQVEAWYSWSSNTSGKVIYIVRDEGEDVVRYESGPTAKKQIGFNPMPTEKNLKHISNFKIVKRKSW